MGEDNETDALLAQLEAKAGSADVVASDEPEEDIEAFLAELESGGGETSTSVATREPDPLDAEFADLGLEEAPDAPLAAVEPEEKTEKKGKKSKKKKDDGKVAVVQRGKSEGFKKVGSVLKWGFFLLPALLGIWLVGAYIAQWVSAAWLVAAVALVCILGVPAALRLASKRGRYGYWLGAISLLAVVGLTAPIPLQAGNVLSKYGHWPVSVVGEIAGWPADHGAVRFTAWFSELTGGLLTGLKSEEPPPEAARLGTDTPLAGEPVVDDAESETGDIPEAEEPVAESDDAEKEAVKETPPADTKTGN